MARSSCFGSSSAKSARVVHINDRSEPAWGLSSISDLTETNKQFSAKMFSLVWGIYLLKQQLHSSQRLHLISSTLRIPSHSLSIGGVHRWGNKVLADLVTSIIFTISFLTNKPWMIAASTPLTYTSYCISLFTSHLCCMLLRTLG